MEYQGTSATTNLFKPENSFCLYFFMHNISRFFTSDEYKSIINTSRKNLVTNLDYTEFNKLLSKIPTEYQLLDKNPLENPLNLLNFLSGRSIMISNLEFTKSFSPKNFENEMKDMISKNFLPYCSESSNFPGRVNFNVEQLEPYDEETMLSFIQVKGPLLVLINGTNIRKHKKGEILKEVPSSSNYS